jgi:hypothetical protein
LKIEGEREKIMKINNLRKTLRSINFRKLAKPAVVKNMKLMKRHACFCVFGLNRCIRSNVFVREIITAKRKLSIITAIIALVMIGLALSVTTFSAISTSTSLASAGTVFTSANLGVYSDSACTQPLSSISWGTLTAGGTSTQTIYIKNTGSGLSLSLSMTTSSWSPASANGPITITWTQENTDLKPGQSTAAPLTLTVSPSISGITSFSDQISITGTN